MRIIRLTRGRVAIVDTKYYGTLIRLGSWSFDGRYAARGFRHNGKQRTERMHTVVMRLAGVKTRCVDHRNTNKLDNRRRNLRPSSPSGNGLNRGPQRNCKSGFKGVSFHKGRWRAVFRCSHLGYFDTPIEAAKAYDKTAFAHNRSFARTNL